MNQSSVNVTLVFNLARKHFGRFHTKSFALYPLFYLIVIFFNLYIRSLIPITAALPAPHDDQLAVEISSNILNGNWLGTWDNRTFVKPPGYSIYLAIAHLIPLPIAVLNQAFYVVILALLIYQLSRYALLEFKYRNSSFFLIFVYMIFQPVMLATVSNRIYRSSVVIIILTLIYSVFLYSLFEGLSRLNNFKALPTKSKWKVYSDFMVLSLIYSILVLFRNESYWIFFCSAPLIFLILLLKYLNLPSDRTEKIAYLKFLLPIPIFAIVVFLIPISGVQQANRDTYGVALIENNFTGSFAEAIKLWTSVDVGRDLRPTVIISNEQRNAVYKISDSALLLKPFLESKEDGWKRIACDKIKICDDAGPWVTFQMRDAAVLTGLVYSERTFQGFFQDITNDIRDACDKSIFKCKKVPTIAGGNYFSEFSKTQILNYTLMNFKLILPTKSQFGDLLLESDNFGASDSVATLFHEVVNYEKITFRSLNQQKLVLAFFKGLNIVYPFLNWLFFMSGLLGVIFGWKRVLTIPIKLVLIFLILGVTSQVVGIAIVNIGGGTVPTSPLYMLAAYPMLYLFNIFGTISLLSYLRRKFSK